MTDLKELRRLAAAASELNPGEWELRLDDDDLPHSIAIKDDALDWSEQEVLVECRLGCATEEGRAIYKYIAAVSPQAVTALLDERDTAYRANTKLETAAIHAIQRAEKAEAERDQLRGQLAAAAVQFQYYADQHLAKSPPDTIKAEVNAVWARRCTEALATPHTAATPIQEHYFVHPSATLTSEEFATEIAKFNEAAKDAKPMDIKAIDAQMREARVVARLERSIAKEAADSVQVRTPGTIEVCELCKVPIAGFFNDGCWRTNHPTAPCPIRLRPTSPDPATEEREGK